MFLLDAAAGEDGFLRDSPCAELLNVPEYPERLKDGLDRPGDGF